MIRQTHTYVELEVSQKTYDEIKAVLKAADYHHLFMEDDCIDMQGIAIKRIKQK